MLNIKYYIFEDPGGRVRYCCQQDPAIPRNPDDILRYSKNWLENAFGSFREIKFLGNGNFHERIPKTLLKINNYSFEKIATIFWYAKQMFSRVGNSNGSIIFAQD